MGGLICGSLVDPVVGGVGFAGRFASAAITFCIPSSSACCLVCDLNPTLPSPSPHLLCFIRLFMHAFLFFLFLFLLFTCEICTLSYLMPLSCCNIWQWEQTHWHCKWGKSWEQSVRVCGFFSYSNIRICTVSYLIPLSCRNIWQWGKTDWHCKWGKTWTIHKSLWEFFYSISTGNCCHFLLLLLVCLLLAFCC